MQIENSSTLERKRPKTNQKQERMRTALTIIFNLSTCWQPIRPQRCRHFFPPLEQALKMFTQGNHYKWRALELKIAIRAAGEEGRPIAMEFVTLTKFTPTLGPLTSWARNFLLEDSVLFQSYTFLKKILKRKRVVLIEMDILILKFYFQRCIGTP